MPDEAADLDSAEEIQRVVAEFRGQQREVSLRLDGGPPPDAAEVELPEPVVQAQDFLWSAQISTENAIESALVLRNLDRVERGMSQLGNMGDREQDLLRAALVFASAGLDSSLKRLIRDALGPLLAVRPSVKEGLEKFSQRFIASSDVIGVDPQALVRILMSDETRPRDVLLAEWVKDLTAGSLQSVDAVLKVCAALGIEDRDFTRRASARTGDTTLRSAFEARNSIVHVLDLRNRSATTSRDEIERRKVYRGIRKIEAWTTEILSVAQLVITDVATALS